MTNTNHRFDQSINGQITLLYFKDVSSISTDYWLALFTMFFDSHSVNSTVTYYTSSTLATNTSDRVWNS